MALPPRVSEAFVRAGASAEVVAALDDLYGHLGPAAIEAVSELIDRRGIEPSSLGRDDLEAVRAIAGEQYLRRHHTGWGRGESSPAFWRDRAMGGGATGLAVPLGDLARPATPWLERVSLAVRAAVGPGQPTPRGLVLLSQNAHRGNQPGNFAFDLVPEELGAALSLNAAEGRHHTLPGSVGETSGASLAEDGLALVWEAQPNIWRPRGERNHGANRAWRRHRCWPLATATAALGWLEERGYRVFVLRGAALRAAHEVDPARPLGPEIERLHEATFGRAAFALGRSLVAPEVGRVPAAIARLSKVKLGELIDRQGVESVVFEVRPRD